VNDIICIYPMSCYGIYDCGRMKMIQAPVITTCTCRRLYRSLKSVSFDSLRAEPAECTQAESLT
jgi:hypothetical protein